MTWRALSILSYTLSYMATHNEACTIYLKLHLELHGNP